MYTVWVNATDPPGINIYTRGWYTFTTELNLPPVFGAPMPANGSANNNLTLTWSIPISDLEGDLVSWSIQCSNGQSNSGTGATNGTKTLSVSGLAYLTNYTMWANASDPLGSGIYTREWYHFITKEFINSPPEKPERPSGSMSGEVNVNYTYSSSTIDVDGGQIWLWFNWGDGSDSGWVGPFNSDTTGSATHMWTIEGSFNITVKAKDVYDAESVWSDPLLVTMPVEVSYLDGKMTNLNPVISELDTSNSTTQTPASTDTSPYENSTEECMNDKSTNEKSVSYSEGKNISEFIRIIIRILKGEYRGMNLIQILRSEGWI
jgi:hypothetical protein